MNLYVKLCRFVIIVVPQKANSLMILKNVFLLISQFCVRSWMGEGLETRNNLTLRISCVSE